MLPSFPFLTTFCGSFNVHAYSTLSVSACQSLLVIILLIFIHNRCTLVIARDTERKFSMDIAERLKELRIQRGYSQSALAKALHVSKSTISMIEVGYRKPSVEVLEMIADFFNVDIDYLMGKETGSTYYMAPEAAEMAQELFSRPELKVLFDASKNASKEDIEAVAAILDRMSKK